ncbi:MAG: hypothetical protein KIT17_20530 [Rubrivivax sp.]|nr:hypothetical protein [Rubrivivax sp.]
MKSATAERERRAPAAWLGQLLLYGLFAAFVGVFSQWPRYHALGPDEALVKVSFVRVGKPVGDCRRLSDAELAKLPPNMRAATTCPRERSPVQISVHIDGERVLERSAAPSGLAKDGASALYERLVVPAGERRITVHLSDDVRARDAGWRRDEMRRLTPGQVLVIDFDAEKGGITFQ